VASPDLAPTETLKGFPAQVAQRRLPILDGILLHGTFSLLLFGPLAFGAVYPWSIFVLESGAALLFLLWAWRQTLSNELLVTLNALFAPMLVFAGLIATQVIFGLSAYRYKTASGALLYCAYGVLCFLVVQSLRRTSQVKTLVVIFCGYGLAVALFAIVQSLTSNGKIYWLHELQHGGWIYGPYVNHNHYAGLMEMLLPMPLVLGLTRYVRGNRRALVAFVAVLMASTIFLSGSRGGMFAFLAQMLLLGVLLARRKSARATLVAGLVMLVIVGLLTWWTSGGTVIDRLASVLSETKAELSGGVRLTVDRDGWKMFAKKPVLGWGLGTFSVVYPQFGSFFTDKFVNEAHNDYVQLLAETGAVGFLTMGWFLVLVYRNGSRKLKDWTSDVNGAVGLAALLGCTGILVHSLVDFNLRIPANAALFYVLCTIAVADTQFRTRRHARRPATNTLISDIEGWAERKDQRSTS
jgi:O-antigen ligase